MAKRKWFGWPACLLILVTLELSNPSRACALCHSLGDRVRTLYGDASVVLVGRVEKVDLIPPGDADVIRYTVTVRELIKGGHQGTVILKEGNYSGRTGLEAGQTYLIFARDWHDSELPSDPGDLWELGYGCAEASDFALPGAETKVGEAKEARRLSLQHAPANIRIKVIKGWPDKGPMEGSKFLLEGIGSTRVAVTDKDGLASLDVSAGHYRLRAMGPGSVRTEHFEESVVGFDVPEGGGWDQLFHANLDWDHGEDCRILVFAQNPRDERPLPSVAVVVQGQGISQTAATDGKGYCGFSVKEGRYAVTATWKGIALKTAYFLERSMFVDLKGGTNLDILFQPDEK